MSIGAEIKTYGERCPVRQQLGAKLIAAVAAVYSRRAEWAAMEPSGQAARTAFTNLQSARDAQLSAEREYRDHVRAHGCAAAGHAKAHSA